MTTALQVTSALNALGLVGVGTGVMALQAQIDADPLHAAPMVTGVGVVKGGAPAGGNGSAASPFPTLEAAAAALPPLAADAIEGAPIVLYVTKADLPYLGNTTPFRRPVVLLLEPGAQFAAGVASLPLVLPTRTHAQILTVDVGVYALPGYAPVGIPAALPLASVPPLAITVASPALYAGRVAYVGQPVMLAGPTFSFGSMVLRDGAMCPDGAAWSLELTRCIAEQCDAGTAGRILAVDSNLRDPTAARVTARGGALGGTVTGDADTLGTRLAAVTAITGDLETDTLGWRDMQNAAVVPTGAVTFAPGTVVSDVVATAPSPMTITLPGSFAGACNAVVTPQVADATTTYAVTSTTANTIVVTYAGTAPVAIQYVAQG